MCGSELKKLPEGVQRVSMFLQERGHPHTPVMLEDAARTAQQAADALGVELGKIAKSIVFRRKSDDAAVLVVISGDQRVDERKVEALLCPDGKRLKRADAEFVKTQTGFSIGGVPPLAHATPVVMLLDRSLMRFDEVWAAAGHPNAVFQAAPQELVSMSGAPVVDVAVDLDQETRDRQHAIKIIASRAMNVRASDENVPSPCISVCRISPESGLCEGCFRTLDEIVSWGRSDADTKRSMWQVINQRIAALPSAA